MPFVPGEKETSTNDPRYGFFQGGIPETLGTPLYPSGSPLCKSVYPYLIYSSSQTDLQTAAGRPGNYPAMLTNSFKSFRKRFEICTLQSAKRHKSKKFQLVPFFFDIHTYRANNNHNPALHLYFSDCLMVWLPTSLSVR